MSILKDLLKQQFGDLSEEQLQEWINLLRRLKIKEPSSKPRVATNRGKRYKDLLSKLSEEEKKLLMEALSEEGE